MGPDPTHNGMQTKATAVCMAPKVVFTSILHLALLCELVHLNNICGVSIMCKRRPRVWILIGRVACPSPRGHEEMPSHAEDFPFHSFGCGRNHLDFYDHHSDEWKWFSATENSARKPAARAGSLHTLSVHILTWFCFFCRFIQIQFTGTIYKSYNPASGSMEELHSWDALWGMLCKRTHPHLRSRKRIATWLHKTVRVQRALLYETHFLIVFVEFASLFFPQSSMLCVWRFICYFSHRLLYKTQEEKRKNI